MALLVDPLAGLFRPAVRDAPLLALESVEIEVELLPPLARVSVTRRFRNGGDGLIEALLTLPPVAPQEVIYGLTVTIDGSVCSAAAQPAAGAERLHHDALLEGRRAILHERIEKIAQLVSIAGIEAGAEVAVRIDSIRSLHRIDELTASLVIALTASPRLLNAWLSDSEALVTTPLRHAASLTVISAGLAVTLDNPERQVSPGVTSAIDCVEDVRLAIGAPAAGGLDRSASVPAATGGWQALSLAGEAPDALRPVPDEALIRERSDWMFGRVLRDDRAIEVLAPLPHPDAAPTARARAMAAFAAASLVAAARRLDADALRRAANVLSDTAHLVFIGPDGELPDEIPVLRKLALAQAATKDSGFESIGFEPATKPKDDAPTLDAPLASGLQHTPGARRPLYLWLIWAPAVLVVVWLLGAIRVIDVPLGPVLVGFVVLMLLNAVRWFPRAGDPVRRRLPLLVVLALPALISLLFGPMGFVEISWHQSERDAMVQFQGWLLAASALLPLLLMPVMRGARAFSAVVGILAFVASFLVTMTAMIMNMPGM